MGEQNLDLNEYSEKCAKILNDPEILFAGLLDGVGSLLAGGYKPGTCSRLTDEQHQIICSELASRVTKRKKFNSELGHVKYSASRRERVVIMSFPIFDKVIMILAEPHINIDRFAFRILSKLDRQWGDNEE
ncbi:MAG: hypothetical protein LVO36_04350 [Nitrosopumilus sp. (ex Thoosa mismalolli)]|nr:hypothetical protein [Nitrosopumilus sp. (ex Thoosa mismalolli)]